MRWWVGGQKRLEAQNAKLYIFGPLANWKLCRLFSRRHRARTRVVTLLKQTAYQLNCIAQARRHQASRQSARPLPVRTPHMTCVLCPPPCTSSRARAASSVGRSRTARSQGRSSRPGTSYRAKRHTCIGIRCRSIGILQLADYYHAVEKP